ncbi:MAG TPA: WD40 repeat domain-containing protein [Gaiellaceae bacterium]
MRKRPQEDARRAGRAAPHRRSAPAHGDGGARAGRAGHRGRGLPLPRHAVEVEIRPVCGSALHPDWTYTTAFSPDGLRTVTAARDGVARIWERGATAPLLELRGHGDVVFAATFDRSGRYVATASADHTVRVWDVETGTVLRGNRSLVNAATFGDDGLVATAGADGTARLFDRAGREVAVLLVTAGRDVLTPAELRRGSPGSPRVTVLARNGAPGPVNGVLFDPTGRTLVTADDDGRVLAWNVETCRRRFLCTASRELGSEPWPSDGIDVVATSTRSKLVAASADWDGVWLYDLDSRDVVARLRSSVETLATDFSRDGRYVLAATTTALRVWDVNGCYATATCKPPRPVTLPQSAIVLRAVFSRDGTRIITGATDRTARIWRWRDHRASPIELRGHTSNVRAVAFDPTGRFAVTGGGDMTTRVWDARSGEFLSVFGLHSAGINDVSFDPNDPSRILSASDDGTVTIHRCDTCGPFADIVRRASAREARVHRKPVWLPGDAPRP